MAKPNVPPNSLIITWPAVGTRALRASRSAHERRAWARCGRERITSALPGKAAGGGLQAHLDALVSHELHTSAPVLSAAPIAKDAVARGQRGADAAGH